MNPQHIVYLRCPKTKRPLELQQMQLEDGRVKEGLLFEPVSGQIYPIKDYIPRFVGGQNYADNFGLEWNIHNRTQFDESSGFNISKSRFKNETKWPDDLKNELVL